MTTDDKQGTALGEREIEDPAPFTPPEELYSELIRTIRSYHPSEDTSLIRKAYEVAAEQHKDQKRRSGEPYIIHPLCVGIILADLEMDKETIAAALLHDVVEDTGMELSEVESEFGTEIANLVDGVTKLTQLNYDKDKIEMQAENLRKMFLAMAKDIRVILIKLADRLHNLRTLQYQSHEKQLEKARETLDIYSPIADRLGISKLKIELDDLSLKYLHPDVYYDLAEKISLKKDEREEFISGIVNEVSQNMADADIKAQVVGRVKHFFSIYKKMVNQQKTLDQIYDLFAVRILVDNVKDCYAALGVIHELYKPIPGRFKDYIAMPKPNMYQSLHTTLIGKKGTPFEVQIRTYEMHRIAEYGIAAHWKYKEVGSGQKASSAEDEKMSWLRQVLEWQRDTDDSKEFLRMVKSDFDLFTDEVYCFTPTGDVKHLPKGSTPIDFAYNIHSAVGNKMVGARVNGKLVPIDYEIHNGDQIEIITSQNSKGPSRDWLSVVKSTQAKNKINAWFKTERKEDNIIRGKEMLEKYCKQKSLSYSELTKPEYVEGVLRRYALKDWNAALASVGHGGLKESQVVNKLLETKQKADRRNMTDADVINANLAENQDITNPTVKKNQKGGIVVKGIHDVAVRYAHCCNPVPGDEIVGFVTRGRGITIHRTDCVNMMNLPEDERSRLIEAEWQQTEGVRETYSTEIKIYCNNRLGLIVDISKIFTEAKIDITSINLKTAKNGTATLILTFDIHGKDELMKLTDKIRSVEGVLDIGRTAG
ncbi:MAG TPA: bifunctional (p)ppGpp synthetase/guanosine-3',5'-bis(diphosphate) 3'-pyrophosphohydrolase [Candidatus Avilachnospira avicola]|nr:bifunctional (p)ppGpp synthetase/guanosine-3',5'-bis(diphosphate) 3'-pyrophosphohydrolase [Candidatus Avilachnospira avicola]